MPHRRSLQPITDIKRRQQPQNAQHPAQKVKDPFKTSDSESSTDAVLVDQKQLPRNKSSGRLLKAEKKPPKSLIQIIQEQQQQKDLVN